jgi:peptide chain release factor 2
VTFSPWPSKISISRQSAARSGPSRSSSTSCGGIFDLDAKRRRISELESLAAEPGFWDKREQAQTLLKETKALRGLVEGFDAQQRKLSDAIVLLDLAEEAGDEASAIESQEVGAQVERALADLEFRRMLSGPDDPGSAVVEVTSGAGGVDAADWAHMLLRMVVRYCEKQGWKVDIVDEQPFEEAGIKSATLVVDGEYAYGLLKAESGVHRLVRISPFDQNARRHTAFAAVSVTPDVEDDDEIEINDEDLRIDVFRAGGAGGQHVNKTESAVRITHLPTGVVVQCQSERSQHKNKSQAMRVLRSRLYDRKQEELAAKAAAAEKQKKKIDFGSQIRSYVLAPYQLVTDHRTELKKGNVTAVLDGDIGEFIREFLLQQANAATSGAN